MNNAYLLIGGNEGDRFHFLQQALTNIELFCGQINGLSSIYETAAWGKTDQAPFLNQAIKIVTAMAAFPLLQTILSIEARLGRKRSVRHAARTIDIDILFYGEAIISDPGLTVPHPEMQYRRFVLEPLNEIAAGFIHPVLLKTVHQLLLDCEDPLGVHKLST
jgi:2-amino-4-hydroxy-6-hydroxymethyldihydropteridine diphosphokinase